LPLSSVGSGASCLIAPHPIGRHRPRPRTIVCASEMDSHSATRLDFINWYKDRKQYAENWVSRLFFKILPCFRKLPHHALFSKKPWNDARSLPQLGQERERFWQINGSSHPKALWGVMWGTFLQHGAMSDLLGYRENSLPNE